jgi:hypothetical protein
MELRCGACGLACGQGIIWGAAASDSIVTVAVKEGREDKGGWSMGGWRGAVVVFGGIVYVMV